MTAAAMAAIAIGLAGATATTTRAGSQFVPPPQRCNLETLRGAYGVQWVGTRPVLGSPSTSEPFTGIAIRTFDGAGTFTQVSNVKGLVGGLEPENIESVGTYDVNEDCSGTATLFVPGGPIVTAGFVIVDGGDEVLQSVMTPVAIFNAAVTKSIHKR
jgi:hypothetical protein